MKIDISYSCTQPVLILLMLQASKYENVSFLDDEVIQCKHWNKVFDKEATADNCCDLAKNYYACNENIVRANVWESLIWSQIILCNIQAAESICTTCPNIQISTGLLILQTKTYEEWL